MEREAPFFQGLFHAEALWNDFGSQSFLKVPNAPLASLAALALRVFIGVSLGFCSVFAGDLGSQTSQTLCKSSAKSLENRAQYPPKSTPKPSRIDPKT
jgi:hypothetical protein